MINRKLRNQLLLYILVLGFSFFSQAQTVEEGKELFQSKACGACHAKDMKTDLVGPALGGVRERWDKQEDLYNWVRNSAGMIAAGHEYGVALFEKFNKVPMLPYPDLKDDQVESILLYIDSIASPKKETSTAELGVDADMIAKGKALFDAKACGACHAKDMKTDLVGPALNGVVDRWSDKAELHNWVRNSQKMVDAGHEYGVKLFERFNKIPMLPYPDLTDEEIDAILLYTQYPNGPPAPEEVTAQEVAQEDTLVSVEESKSFFSSNLFYIILLLIAGFLAVFLAKTVAKLKNQAEEKAYGELGSNTVFSVLLSRKVLKFATFAFIVFGLYFTAIKAMNLGRQQNYQPDQPLIYSHKVHAGDNKINCEFCHDGARRSKHAMIPGTNTCMKCHKGIKNGSLYGTAEITKIYASIGFDPVKGKYIDGYNDLNQDEVKDVFTNWIARQNTEFGEDEVTAQWENIATSLTNAQKKQVQGPIEWVRVHNLPDHVYFNHAQHVDVGKISCQTCHGPVEEMEVVRQYAPLSMGWCVNCHRVTEVQFADNPYYENYEKYHQEIVDGTRDKVTVEDIGGLECQKCHY